MDREAESKMANDLIGFLAAYDVPIKNAKNILWTAYDRFRVMSEDDYKTRGEGMKMFAKPPAILNPEKPN